MNFDAKTYAELAAIVFQPGYPGLVKYTEAPDGMTPDKGKVYAHIAMRYMGGPGTSLLMDAFAAAHSRTVDLWRGLGLPAKWQPHASYGALRVLRYPPGVAGAAHTDYDLCTLALYRNETDRLRPDIHWPLHYGEIAEMLGFGKALRHWVVASPNEQHSILYAAMPNMTLTLPDGRTVAEWFKTRSAQARK